MIRVKYLKISLEIECDFINVSFCTSLLAVLNYFMKLVENGSMNATSSLVLSSPNFEQVKMLCSVVVSSKGYCSCLFFCQNINGWAWESIFTTISR